MALLEHRFKTSLLERSPRGVELTPAGASLLVHAKALLMRMNEMQAEMNDHATGKLGALRILANTSAMTEFLPYDLANYSRIHPEVRLVVEERWSAEIAKETAKETAKEILSADADIGIIVEGLRTEGLDVYPYRRDRIAAVKPSDHTLATNESMRFIDVLDHDLVALESGSSMMRLLAERAVVAERTLQLRIQVRSFEAVCRMVQAGRGIGLLPYQAALAMGQAMGLVVRQLPEDWAKRNMLICVRKHRATNTSVETLLKHLSSSAPSPT